MVEDGKGLTHVSGYSRQLHVLSDTSPNPKALDRADQPASSVHEICTTRQQAYAGEQAGERGEGFSEVLFSDPPPHPSVDRSVLCLPKVITLIWGAVPHTCRPAILLYAILLAYYQTWLLKHRKLKLRAV
jgi:hypothetical protein